MSVLVFLSPRARREALEVHAEWYSSHPQTQFLFREELLAALGRLSDFPDLGRLYPSKKHPDRRRLLLPSTGYHLYYRYRKNPNEVYVLSVWRATRGRGPRV